MADTKPVQDEQPSMLPRVRYVDAYWVVVDKLKQAEGLSMFTEDARRSIARVAVNAIFDMKER